MTTSSCWPLSYQLHVVAPRASEVVASIGGWLFDHVSAGWKTSVMLSQPAEPAALSVLGIKPATIDPRSWVSAESVHVIAAATELYNSDAALRRHIDRASRDSRKEVLLWGPTTRALCPKASRALHYQPSRAACVFKTHAMAATSPTPGSVATDETFYRLARHGSAGKRERVDATDDVRVLGRSVLPARSGSLR